MTAHEKECRDIFLPPDIVLWFADYLERTFSKALMRWDSALFAESSVKPLTEELYRISEHRS